MFILDDKFMNKVFKRQKEEDGTRGSRPRYPKLIMPALQVLLLSGVGDRRSPQLIILHFGELKAHDSVFNSIPNTE